MTPASLLRLWLARMGNKSAFVQESLVVVGIAVGVALLFASQVASTSLTGSVKDLTNQVIGRGPQLQLQARGPAGVDERLLEEARRLPSAASALPVLEVQAVVIGHAGRRSVDLLGTTPQFARTGGPLLRRFSDRQLTRLRAIALPAPIAEAIGASALEHVRLQVGANITRTYLGATLSAGAIGGLAQSPVAIAPIAYAQQVSGMTRRITRVFVRPKRGQEQQLRAELVPLAASFHVNVEPADFDSRLFDVASNLVTQSEDLFSAISALVGLLFALTAILLTVPRRRRTIEELQLHGAGHAITLQVLLFDALVLGTLGCLLGVVLGDALSLAVFNHAPAYLSAAFPVGNARIVTWRSVALAVVPGLLSAIVGVLWPLRSLLTDSRTATPVTAAGTAIRVAVGVACAVVAVVILLAHPSAALPGSAALLVALILLLAPTFDAALAAFGRIQSRVWGGAASELAAVELTSPRVRVRALAITATAAIMVFGTVAVGGAQSNLRSGLDASARGIDSSADVWVSPGGEASVLATTPFESAAAQAIGRLPGVATLGVYRGSFLNWGTRRLWVLAQPSNSKAPIPAGQLIAGSPAVARAMIRSGGWAVLSQALAHEDHLHVGDRFLLPSPQPSELRVAGLSTNLGWPPGAIVMNSGDYARAWASNAASAYQIQTASNVTPASVRQRVLGALHKAGLVVETEAERQARHYALASQGLSRLTQIKTLLLIAGVLAVAGAMSSLIWQRREQIAAIRVQGYTPVVLWQWLCCESALMLGAGCCVGAAFGIAGQLLLSHAVQVVTGFPIELGLESTVVIVSFLSVGLIAFTIASVPGYVAVHAAPRAVSARLSNA